MDEHVHEWYFDQDASRYKCEHPKCRAELGLFAVEDRLNEYDRLKKATDALNAEFVVCLAEWCEATAMEPKGENTTGNALRAYADILEGK